MGSKEFRLEEEWKKILSPEEYQVLRQKGTERPFTGKYWNTSEKGIYRCAGCGAVLFNSDAKFDAGCGWPSFYKPVDAYGLDYRKDTSFGMVRTEVLCSNCGSHLGHVFSDGPQPTGMRYCINSISLKFQKEK
jgi:peptide-methionine (R)-S-oxide reductase